MKSITTKPMYVEAVQWDGSKEHAIDLESFVDCFGYTRDDGRRFLHISTPYGYETAEEHDWIIKWPHGPITVMAQSDISDYFRRDTEELRSDGELTSYSVAYLSQDIWTIAPALT